MRIFTHMFVKIGKNMIIFHAETTIFPINYVISNSITSNFSMVSLDWFTFDTSILLGKLLFTLRREISC